MKLFHYLICAIMVMYNQSAFCMKALAAKQKAIAAKQLQDAQNMSPEARFFAQSDVRQRIEEYATAAFNKLSAAYANDEGSYNNFKDRGASLWNALAAQAQRAGIADLKPSNSYVLMIYKKQRDTLYNQEINNFGDFSGTLSTEADKRKVCENRIKAINTAVAKKRTSALEEDAKKFGQYLLEALVRKAKESPFPIDITDQAVITEPATSKIPKKPSDAEQPQPTFEVPSDIQTSLSNEVLNKFLAAKVALSNFGKEHLAEEFFNKNKASFDTKYNEYRREKGQIDSWLQSNKDKNSTIADARKSLERTKYIEEINNILPKEMKNIWQHEGKDWRDVYQKLSEKLIAYVKDIEQKSRYIQGHWFIGRYIENAAKEYVSTMKKYIQEIGAIVAEKAYGSGYATTNEYRPFGTVMGAIVRTAEEEFCENNKDMIDVYAKASYRTQKAAYDLATEHTHFLLWSNEKPQRESVATALRAANGFPGMDIRCIQNQIVLECERNGISEYFKHIVTWNSEAIEQGAQEVRNNIAAYERRMSNLEEAVTALKSPSIQRKIKEDALTFANNMLDGLKNLARAKNIPLLKPLTHLTEDAFKAQEQSGPSRPKVHVISKSIDALTVQDIIDLSTKGMFALFGISNAIISQWGSVSLEDDIIIANLSSIRDMKRKMLKRFHPDRAPVGDLAAKEVYATASKKITDFTGDLEDLDIAGKKPQTIEDAKKAKEAAIKAKSNLITKLEMGE